jgi:hypothetical protein
LPEQSNKKDDGKLKTDKEAVPTDPLSDDQDREDSPEDEQSTKENMKLAVRVVTQKRMVAHKGKNFVIHEANIRTDSDQFQCHSKYRGTETSSIWLEFAPQ